MPTLLQHRRFAFILTLALLSLATGCATQPERVAFIIGNSAYSHASPLKNPSNDASALAEAFTRLGFRVIQGRNLSHEGMERQMRNFYQYLGGAETAVFFYAGHGLVIDGKNFLVPVDFDPERDEYLTTQLVQLDSVLDEMANRAQHSLVFMDACRDNPFTATLVSKLAKGRSVPVDATRGVKVVGKGLAEAKGNVGMLIAYATQPGNVASDGSGAHSPFATGLLKYVDEPGLEVRELLSKVRMSVVGETAGQQIPWDHSSLTENYYLKKKPFEFVPPSM
jgi:uncharacterized caspase-like protein